REPVAGMREVKTNVKACGNQQKPGNELAGAGCVDAYFATTNVAVPLDGERKRPIATVININTQVAQRADHFAHRTVQGVVIGGDEDVAAGETSHGRDKPHDGAGLTAVDGRASGEGFGR